MSDAMKFFFQWIVIMSYLTRGHWSHPWESHDFVREFEFREDVEPLITQEAETERDRETDTEVGRMVKYAAMRSLVGPDIRKVIEFAYMRGGSSIIGQLFNNLPLVSFWYEPLNFFYSHYSALPPWTIGYDITQTISGRDRNIPLEEKDALAKFMTDIFDCNYYDLPAEVLSLPSDQITEKMTWAKRYYGCLAKQNPNTPYHCSETLNGYEEFCSNQKCKAFRNNCARVIKTVHESYVTGNRNLLEPLTWVPKNTLIEFERRESCLKRMRIKINNCLLPFKNKCMQTKIRSAKLLRIRMHTIEHIIAKDPSLLLIHIIRDPRAIMVSRIGVDLLSFNAHKSAEKEGIILCQQMVEDYQARGIMERKYPRSFLQIKYEDLTMDLHGTLIKFTDHLSIPGKQFLEEKTYNMLFANNLGEKGDFQQLRSNATETAMAWRSSISKELKHVMDGHKSCQEAYRLFGYSV